MYWIEGVEAVFGYCAFYVSACAVVIEDYFWGEDGSGYAEDKTYIKAVIKVLRQI